MIFFFIREILHWIRPGHRFAGGANDRPQYRFTPGFSQIFCKKLPIDFYRCASRRFFHGHFCDRFISKCKKTDNKRHYWEKSAVPSLKRGHGLNLLCCVVNEKKQNYSTNT